MIVDLDLQNRLFTNTPRRRCYADRLQHSSPRDRGHLLLEDGIGAARSSRRLPRVGHGLKRLVVIGSDGLIALAALRWLADQKVAFAYWNETVRPWLPSDRCVHPMHDYGVPKHYLVNKGLQSISRENSSTENCGPRVRGTPQAACARLRRFNCTLPHRTGKQMVIAGRFGKFSQLLGTDLQPGHVRLAPRCGVVG